MIRDPYAKARQRELAKWPGARAETTAGGSHLKVHIHLEGQSRLVVTCVSPSDRRGIHNHIAIVRRALREMSVGRS